MKKVKLSVLLSLGALCAIPAISQATVTIGSDLEDPANIGIGCIGSCTRVQTSLRPEEQAANGYASPVNGTVVTWRIKSVASATQVPVAFRVISPAANGQFTGGGVSGTSTPPDQDTVTPYAAAIPIKVGDLLGLNFGATANYFNLSAGPNSGQLFNPTLAQGSTRTPQSNTSEELLVNADIEPTATLSNIKAKGKPGGKVKLTVEVPNPGTLVVGDKKDKGVVAVTAAKKPTLVKNKRTQVSTPSTVSLILKPTKTAKSYLAAGQKPKAKLKLVFTPTGGKTYSKLIQVKLKP